MCIRNQAYIGRLEVARRVSDRGVATARIPTEQAAARQRHAGQRFKALCEVDLLGDSRDYSRASELVKRRIGVFEKVCECLAVLAVANGASRHAWTHDIAFDLAASTLEGMVHFASVSDAVVAPPKVRHERR